MKKQLVIYALPLLIFGMGVNKLNAQTPFSPNTYSGWVSTPTNSFATIPAAPGVLFTQIARGTGNTFSTATDGINSSKWNNSTANGAITANQSLTFSVSSNSATTFEIDSISLILGRSNAGPDSCILQYKLTSAGNNFTSVAAGVRVILNPTISPTTTLSIIPASPIMALANDTVVFRLVAWHASSTLGTMKLMNNTRVYGKAITTVTNSIAAPAVQTSNTTCVSTLHGDSVQVTFHSTGIFNSGNTYSLELSDASGSFSAPLIIGSITSTLNTGTINAFIPAGTASANYQLRIQSNNPVITGLDTTHLMVRPGMILSASVLQPDCPDSTGEIDLAITGGSGTLQYNWSNTGSTQDLNNLSSGIYSVNVTDAAGCSADSSFSIQSVPSFTVLDSVSPVSCHSESTGRIELTVSGATAPYSISWSGNGISQTGLVAGNLAAGTYSVSITDANNCPYSNTYAVNEPNAIAVSDSIVNVTCNDESNGSIYTAVSGGTAPYLITWSGNGTNQTGPIASNLAAGDYDVMLMDSHNCMYTNHYTITEPASIFVSALVVPATCSSCTGSISLNVNGGTAPYSFDWDNNSTLQTISATPGTYCVSISDLNTCESDSCFTISSTAGLADVTTDSGIHVFPNPAIDAFQIAFPQTLNGIEKKLIILNSLGEVILQKAIDPAAELETIQVQNWTRGVYIYQIQSESGVIETGKINLIN